MTVRRLFTQHPHSRGETYFEHQRHALGFAVSLLSAGTACLFHALVPALFPSTASRTVSRLHERMLINRTRYHRAAAQPLSRMSGAALRIIEETIEPPPGGFWAA